MKTNSFIEDASEHEIPSWVEPLVIIIILVLNAGVGIY